LNAVLDKFLTALPKDAFVKFHAFFHSISGPILYLQVAQHFSVHDTSCPLQILVGIAGPATATALTYESSEQNDPV